MNSGRLRTNPGSGKSWTRTRDRRIASPTRWQLGHAATNWSVRKWYSWINSGDHCNIWNIIDTSTILSTQGWINSIAISHSKMGSVLKVWTKPRVRTHLESPWKSLSFKIKIQGLESPWKLQSALESPWISVLTLSNTDSQVSKRSKHRKTYQGKIAHVVEEPKNWQTQGSFLH